MIGDLSPDVVTPLWTALRGALRFLASDSDEENEERRVVAALVGVPTLKSNLLPAPFEPGGTGEETE